MVLGRPVTSRGTYATPIQVDPFTISSEQKLQLLIEADKLMSGVRGIRVRQGNLVLIKERKTFANSEGAHIEQTILRLVAASRPQRGAR